MSDPPHGKIDLATLRRLIDTGQIDTVISAICDMQGRLVGKRVTGQFFVDHCIEHGTHFCVYFLATDMEMGTPSGYPGLSWESGYGDWLTRPDWNTLRVIPWLEKTAMVLADAVDEEKAVLVEIAPRTVLRRQVERARQLRLNRQPSGRFGKPEDIVNCALYLASDDSEWTNGAVLVVDGGITSNYF